MSLIERVVDKLGSVGQLQRRPSADLETAEVVRPAGVIERAASRKARLPDFPEDRSPVVEADVRPEAAVPSRTTVRSLHIDMERLHRQSIITPGGGRTPMAESFRRVKRHILANMTNAEAGHRVAGRVVVRSRPASWTEGWA